MDTISIHHHRIPLFPTAKPSTTLITPHHHHHHHHHRRRRPVSAKIIMSSAVDSNYDRLKELKQFDDSKIGVKGLVDRGLTTIPPFFIHPTPIPTTNPPTQSPPSIPIIDFSSPRSTLVNQIHSSSSSHGFFQIINHKIPTQTIKHLLDSIRTFNDLPEHSKTPFYRRDMTHAVSFSTNFDLYQSQAASWRDTLQVRLGPAPPDWDHVPGPCKAAIEEWDREVVAFGEELMGLLCEGLGLEDSSVLKELSCLERRIMVAHYYPYCMQPELTMGLTSHTDPGVVTVLVQNEVAGLQVKVEGQWVDVEPVEGAIVINIGDILQIMSNDEYKSVEHRVVANSFDEPRVSVAVFFNPSHDENLFGPLTGLVSPEKPAKYRQFTLKDYLKRFFTKELDGKTLTNYYRVSNDEKNNI